jgi:hypothetical protein
MLTRRCRALSCPRHVARQTLFCNLHFKQLPDRYRQPIARNVEVPLRATITDAHKIISGTAAAVAYLAGKEGLKTALAEAERQAASAPAIDPGGTGSGAVAQATGSGGSTRDIGRRNVD